MKYYTVVKLCYRKHYSQGKMPVNIKREHKGVQVLTYFKIFM